MPDVKVFLLGGGKSEKEVFDHWTAKYPSVLSLIGKLKMDTELNLMSHLDVILSMDSANMHLASLVNVPVVSVWVLRILMPDSWAGNSCRPIRCNLTYPAVHVRFTGRSLAGVAIMPA